jgi:hypothetical protein
MPQYTFCWYLAIVVVFALTFMHFGQLDCHVVTNGTAGCRPFAFDEALVFSATSFHGRGFFPGGLALNYPVTKLAAGEAVLGLFIEISFIASFTQRFLTR